ncbi:MAG: nitroreductase family protein, partial [Planctomycetota bacterium]|nr:nitroreductase family protein [Planctomycetota bacterium]
MKESLRSIMESRRSVRSFASKPVPKELVTELLEAAVTAPSASNKQPWRFLVLQSQSLKDQLAETIREASLRVEQSIDEDFKGVFANYGDYFTRFQGAPLVIVVLYRSLTLLSNMIGENLGEDDRRAIEVMEERSGLVSASLAIQNLLLMAHEKGLGASGMTGPLIANSAIRDMLKVSQSWSIAAFIPLGFPAEDPKPKGRKSLDKIVKWLD